MPTEREGFGISQSIENTSGLRKLYQKIWNLSFYFQTLTHLCLKLKRERMVQKELTLNGQRLTASDGFLKKHYRRSGQMLDSDLWLNDYKCHAENLRQQRTSGNWVSTLNASTCISQFQSLCNFRIDADLSYMNQILLKLNQCCCMSHTMNVPGVYGQTLRISDMAATAQVLKESENGKGKEPRSRWT